MAGVAQDCTDKLRVGVCLFCIVMTGPGPVGGPGQAKRGQQTFSVLLFPGRQIRLVPAAAEGFVELHDTEKLIQTDLRER